MSVAIDLRCTGCGACLATCPERALLAAPRRPIVVVDRCTTCLACVEVCPSDAVFLAAGTRVLRTTPAAAGGDPSPAGPRPAAAGGDPSPAGPHPAAAGRDPSPAGPHLAERAP